MWRTELHARTLHWRMLRARVPGRFQAVPGHRHASEHAAERVTFDELHDIPRLARAAGLTSELYVSLFDEGWPLAAPEVRAVSFHNAMHGKDVAWQSQFSLDHPEVAEIDRDGVRQWGVLSLAYPDVRQHFVDRFTGWLDRSGFDGLFVCLRSQSKPAEHGDQFGFGEPIRAEFERRHRRDIVQDAFECQPWRDLRGEYLTLFLRELRRALEPRQKMLSIGVARGDVIGPPLGNMTLDWQTWARERLIDALIVNQNSSQCPSMWHQLWPMHRGTGYVQNYLTGEGLPPLEAQLRDVYAPGLANTGVRLYVARQWDARDPLTERRLTSILGVDGLVYSSFRHDNPRAIARGDWRV